MEYEIDRVDMWPDSDETLELADDANILDAEIRGGNRVTIIVATPVETAYRCGVNGCSRDVGAPEETCWQHDTDG